MSTKTAAQITAEDRSRRLAAAARASQREYGEKQEQARNLLAAIAEHLEVHEEDANGRAHWGHVGDLGYVNMRLAEVLEFLVGEVD